MPGSDKAKERVRVQRLVAEPQGKLGFLSARLPPEPAVRVAGELGARLADAERALCRLNGALAAVPDLEPFVATRLRQEAVLSAGLAGQPTSLQALLAAEGGMSGPEDSVCAAEAVGCLRAMQHGLLRVREQPLDSCLLTEVHRRLFGDQLKSSQDPEVQSDTGTRSETPSGALDEASLKVWRPDAAPRSWDEVATFVLQPGNLPILIRIGLARAQFELMRPFRAGTGRMGRLLPALLLQQHALVREPVLLFSRQFPGEGTPHDDHPPETGDWEGWLGCFLRGIDTACAASEQAVQRFAKLREEHRVTLVGHLGHAVGRGLRVLDHLYREPVLTAAGVRQITGTSYVAANQLVSRFVDLGILEEITGQRRNRRFQYGSYLRIFDTHSTDWPGARRAPGKHLHTLRPARPAATDAARAKAESVPARPQLREAHGKLPQPALAGEYEPPRSSGPEPISDDLL